MNSIFAKNFFLLVVVVATISIISIETRSLPKAPSQWREHWFEHNQLLNLVHSETDVAVYFDNDVNPSITWPNGYLSRVWRYVKETYGGFGPEADLYAVFHSGKYSGGHPSTYFDESHDYHNVIDVGSSNSDAWTSGQGNDLDIVTHEVAHIVEGASKGIHNSPAFPIWGDSKWAEIFNYDVYLALGMNDDATRWYNMMIQGNDNGVYWFRDWFYPIYANYGGKQVLNNFFNMLAQHFPKNGNSYSRNLNKGEFVHFWSGAAGHNLKDQATTAFGWDSNLNNEFNNAQNEFPNISYS